MSRIIGYSYDAALHCLDCTCDRFVTEPSELTKDSEGNPVHPIFSTDETGEGGDYCDDCKLNIRE